jgi:hypothetical protein
MQKLLIFVLILAGVAFATPPMFHNYVYVEANNSPIAVSSHANPSVIDWDGDGVKDLLLGEFTGGMIRFYSNDGSNSAPHFTTFTYLQADGAIIQLPYG